MAAKYEVGSVAGVPCAFSISILEGHTHLFRLLCGWHLHASTKSCSVFPCNNFRLFYRLFASIVFNMRAVLLLQRNCWLVRGDACAAQEQDP
eukprot:310446-Pelagomonas_calceolata.AAC.2